MNVAVLLSLACGENAPLGKHTPVGSTAWGGNGMSESSSGDLYRAKQACKYAGERRFAGNSSIIAADYAAGAKAPGKHCERWAVATTIFAPSTTIEQIAAIPGWCLVVAGDKKTPNNFAVPGVVYLSPEEQEQMSFTIGKLLRSLWTQEPWLSLRHSAWRKVRLRLR